LGNNRPLGQGEIPVAWGGRGSRKKAKSVGGDLQDLEKNSEGKRGKKFQRVKRISSTPSYQVKYVGPAQETNKGESDKWTRTKVSWGGTKNGDARQAREWSKRTKSSGPGRGVGQRVQGGAGSHPRRSCGDEMNSLRVARRAPTGGEMSRWSQSLETSQRK